MKNFIKNSIIITALLTSTFVAKAQVKIGDNPTTINAGSVLELESTNKGFMMPRISLTSTTVWGLLGTATAGMTVYNTNAAIISGSTSYPNNGIGEYYWDGTGWVAKKGSVSGSGFSQTIYGPGASYPQDWPFGSYGTLIAQIVTVPRDGKYLLIGTAQIGMPGVLNASFNAFGTGEIQLRVDSGPGSYTSQAGGISGIVLNDNSWNVNFSVSTAGTVHGVVYLTKGNHNFIFAGQIVGRANVASVAIINPSMTIVATGE